MLTISSAQDRVEKYLKNLEASAGDELCILVGETIECRSGWVFFFNSRKFLQTGDPKYTLAGNGPVLVDMRSGEVVQLGTAHAVRDYIAHYESTGAVLR